MPFKNKAEKIAYVQKWKRDNRDKVAAHNRRAIAKRKRLTVEEYDQQQLLKKLKSAERRERSPRQARTLVKRNAKERNIQYVLQYKLANPCPCGQDDPVCLDFHHRDPSQKEKTISQMTTKPVAIVRLQAEIDKCDILCKNCHAKLHDGLKRGETLPLKMAA